MSRKKSRVVDYLSTTYAILQESEEKYNERRLKMWPPVRIIISFVTVREVVFATVIVVVFATAIVVAIKRLSRRIRQEKKKNRAWKALAGAWRAVATAEKKMEEKEKEEKRKKEEEEKEETSVQ